MNSLNRDAPPHSTIVQRNLAGPGQGAYRLPEETADDEAFLAAIYLEIKAKGKWTYL